MEHAFAQTHSAESFPKGLASRRNSGDSVACARDDRVGRSEGFAICHPERSAQREVEGSRAAPAEEGSTPAVAFEHVSKRFGDAVAVDDANLDIDEGAFVTIIGSPDPDMHHGVISFNVDGIHPHDVASILDMDQVAIRAGHHCAQPLLTWLGVENLACCRASLAFYNDKKDVDALIEGLGNVWRTFNG